MAEPTSEQVPPPLEDHPEGEEIRRQVEFYFSDENLPTDYHLLQFVRGRENAPVSISRITGFKKMRKYKPKRLVVAALRKSTFLDVSDDGKTIKRKVPLQGKCVLDPDFLEEYEDSEIAYAPRPFTSLHQLPDMVIKSSEKPTGFEDGYVEPLLRPEEAEEEKNMYDPERTSLIDRLELAIQRFKQRRRMRPEYAQIFNIWMRFGGVECGPRMFGGVSKSELKEMDSEQIARTLATHSIPWSRQNEKEWKVDFAAVGAAFLSSSYPTRYGSGPSLFKTTCQVLRSFYNYLLYHSVCPEYDADIKVARTLCDKADVELPKIAKVRLALPGAFNKSASVVFGGSWAGLFTGNQAWAQELKDIGVDMEEFGISDEEARVRFNTGVTVMGSDKQQKILDAENIKVLKDDTFGLEIIAIHSPEDAVRELCQTQSDAWKDKIDRLEPLGKLICKRWYAEDSDEWDLPKDKYPDGIPVEANEAGKLEFWMEESVLDDCFPGMKMLARVLTIEGGITILDEARDVMCSFYKWLPNELCMENRPKEIKWLSEKEAEKQQQQQEGLEPEGEKAADDGSDFSE